MKSGQFDRTCHTCGKSINQCASGECDAIIHSLLWHPECWRGTWGWVPAQPGPSSPCVNSRLTAPSLWEVCFACWPDANAQLKGSVPDFIRGLGDMCQVPAAHTSYQPSIQSQLKDPLWDHTDPSGLGWMPGSLLATKSALLWVRGQPSPAWRDLSEGPALKPSSGNQGIWA